MADASVPEGRRPADDFADGEPPAKRVRTDDEEEVDVEETSDEGDWQAYDPCSDNEEDHEDEVGICECHECCYDDTWEEEGYGEDPAELASYNIHEIPRMDEFHHMWRVGDLLITAILCEGRISLYAERRTCGDYIAVRHRHYPVRM